MLVQTSLLKVPAVRRAFGIPLLPKNIKAKPVTFKESIEYLKKSFQEQRAIAEHRATRKW